MAGLTPTASMAWLPQSNENRPRYQESPTAVVDPKRLFPQIKAAKF
jgi:hypothetical protein